VMSNPASVGICLVRSQGFRRAERFAGVGTFFAFLGRFGSEPHGAEVERTITVYRKTSPIAGANRWPLR